MDTKKVNYDELTYYKEVKVLNKAIRDDPIELSIEIRGVGSDEPDCKIGNFALNFWIRTPYGIKGKKYKNCGTLEKAVKKVLENNGFKVLEWIEA